MAGAAVVGRTLFGDGICLSLGPSGVKIGAPKLPTNWLAVFFVILKEQHWERQIQRELTSFCSIFCISEALRS